MNFFFHTQNSLFNSKITIPKFQNSGKFLKNLILYKADIQKGNWVFTNPLVNEDKNFWEIQGDTQNTNSIYFLAKKNEVALARQINKLYDFNKHTNTSPDYRANLLITNSYGGFSSYQSDYPCKMTTKLGTLYSDCGSLTFEKCILVGVFIKNIYAEPIYKNIPLYLYDNIEGKVIADFLVSLNKTVFIDLTKFKAKLSHCFIFAKNFLGIPIYVVQYEDGNISFEHTHPPHEFIGGPKRFDLVNKLKRKVNEKIS